MELAQLASKQYYVENGATLQVKFVHCRITDAFSNGVHMHAGQT